jgi:hypothetical protein
MAIATNSVYFMGVASLSIGLLALISPFKAAEVFGVALISPSSSSSTSPPSTLAFLAAKGGRDISLGICYFALGYQREFSAVRVLMMAHAVTGVVDAVAVYRYGLETKAWGHGIGTAGLVLFLVSGVGW